MSMIDLRIGLGLIIVSVSAIPISRLFQWLNPDTFGITCGGFGSLIILPLIVRFMSGKPSHNKHAIVTTLAMVFSPLMFASSIDLIISLEYDGFISGYMAFYLVKAEPYLDTAYSAAICYWDGIAHYCLYWLMLCSYANSLDCFRSASFYWFGTFFTSMIVLLVGAITGPFTVHQPILLNVLYVILPIVFLGWVLQNTKRSYSERQIATTRFGHFFRHLLILMFLSLIGMSVLRGLAVFGSNKELLRNYVTFIEKPLIHSFTFPKITVLVYFFYGVPLFLYCLYCLLINTRTPHLTDVSLLLAGMTANGQIGYIGVYFTGKPDIIEFENDTNMALFWAPNILLCVVPHIFALYCQFSASNTRNSKLSKAR